MDKTVNEMGFRLK